MSTTNNTALPGKDNLVDRLNEAMSLQEQDEHQKRVREIKDVLIDFVESGEPFVEEDVLEPTPDTYARHLVHLDPEERYSVLAMVWGPGQGTPLHDHAGNWCVECVCEGRIRVTSFDLQNETKWEDPLYFEKQDEVISGIADAGALIPPYEFHKIENTFEEPAVTIHVYEGEMTTCNAFYPLEKANGYTREEKELSYTSRLTV